MLDRCRAGHRHEPETRAKLLHLLPCARRPQWSHWKEKFLKRSLTFVVVTVFAASVLLPAAAFAEPETFAPSQTASVVVSPQSLAVQDAPGPTVLRDAYTIEYRSRWPASATRATAIPGLLTAWPCSGRVNDGYGDRDGGFHYGADIICGYGTPVVAAGPGVVLEISMDGSWGQYIKIDHGNGVATLCAHMVAGSPTVQLGEPVTAGQQIGLVGDTGNATVAHCHFEVWVNGARVDPIPWLP